MRFLYLLAYMDMKQMIRLEGRIGNKSDRPFSISAPIVLSALSFAFHILFSLISSLFLVLNRLLHRQMLRVIYHVQSSGLSLLYQGMISILTEVFRYLMDVIILSVHPRSRYYVICTASRDVLLV